MDAIVIIRVSIAKTFRNEYQLLYDINFTLIFVISFFTEVKRNTVAFYKTDLSQLSKESPMELALKYNCGKSVDLLIQGGATIRG